MCTSHIVLVIAPVQLIRGVVQCHQGPLLCFFGGFIAEVDGVGEKVSGNTMVFLSSFSFFAPNPIYPT